jgi:hypothetical protein
MALIFLLIRKKSSVMELATVIFTFLLAYGVFIAIAYILARLFFPTLNLHDEHERIRRMKSRTGKRLAS